MKKVIFISLAVVLAGAIAAGIFYYDKLRNGSAKASQSDLPTVVVEKGNLVATISTNGNVVLPDQQNLSFGVSGTIKELKVENGSVVKKGDLLAVLDTILLERAVAQAEANMESAEINLKKTQNPYKASDLVNAEAAVVSAQVALKEAQKSLDDYMNLYDETDIQLAEADIRNAKLNLESALLDQKLNLRVKGQTVGRSYEQEIQEAETARQQALVAYKKLIWAEAGGREVIYRLDAIIQDTEYHLKLNPKKLGFIAEEAFDPRVENAYWKWINADIDLQKLKVEETKNKDTLQNNVDKARDAVIRAEQKLADTKKWPEASEIEVRKSKIESVEQVLKRAEANLADIKAGADPLDIELRNNQIKQSKISLDTVRDNLEKARLVAPFDGTIFNLTAKPGQEVSGNTVVMQIVNPRRVRIDAFIDEVDIARVREGQESELTFDALPGVTLPGKVSTVSYIATKQSGVTSFATNIELDVSRRVTRAGQPAGQREQTLSKPGAMPGKAPAAKNGGATSKTGGGGNLLRTGKPGQGLVTPEQRGGPAPDRGEQRARPILREGMTAIVTIFTEKREGVLTVPNRAIVTQGRNRIVKVKVGATTEERPVRTGLTDGSRTEIVSGLEEGEIVIVEPPKVRSTAPRAGKAMVPGKFGF